MGPAPLDKTQGMDIERYYVLDGAIAKTFFPIGHPTL